VRTLQAILVSTRPAQWVKNLFVAAPVLFAKAHTSEDPALILRAMLAVLVFVLLSGAVYLMNDVLDAERDRRHPVKCRRPVASGVLDPAVAVAAGLLCLASALAAGIGLGAEFQVAALAYLVLNVGYSLSFKNLPYLDVLTIATGFLLRILAGSFAIGLRAEEISYFLVACTFLVALFLAIGKRIVEFKADNGALTRAVLGRYRFEHLQVALWVSGALTAVAYGLYTIAPRTTAYFGHHRLVGSFPFVLVGLWRFAHLVRHSHAAQSPTDAMIRDRWFVLNVLAWFGVVVWAVYG